MLGVEIFNFNTGVGRVPLVKNTEVRDRVEQLAMNTVSNLEQLMDVLGWARTRDVKSVICPASLFSGSNFRELKKASEYFNTLNEMPEFHKVCDSIKAEATKNKVRLYINELFPQLSSKELSEEDLYRCYGMHHCLLRLSPQHKVTVVLDPGSRKLDKGYDQKVLEDNLSTLESSLKIGIRQKPGWAFEDIHEISNAGARPVFLDVLYSDEEAISQAMKALPEVKILYREKESERAVAVANNYITKLPMYVDKAEVIVACRLSIESVNNLWG